MKSRFCVETNFVVKEEIIGETAEMGKYYSEEHSRSNKRDVGVRS